MTTPEIAIAIVPSSEHNLESHPENVGRFQFFHQLAGDADPYRLHQVDPLPAASEDLQRVHPLEYLQALERAVEDGPGFVDYGDTYITPDSFRAAQNAVGGLISVIQAIHQGSMENGLALIRPPGHHATANMPMGFCLLNNVAIAARYAQELGYRRVMIVDFDVHHGNGTQAIFQADPDIFYLSTHQVGIFPGTGHIHEVGIGAGEGSLVNLPLPPGAGDNAIRSICEQVLIPAAGKFQPELMLVSAGFDAHWNDPLANLQFTISGYHLFAEVLKSIANQYCSGKIIFVLEGGYNPQTLFRGVRSVLLALADQSPAEIPGDLPPLPEPTIESIIAQVRQIHDL